MIRSSTQLKDLVRNKSKGDSNKAQIIIRSYIMERFLERVSFSEYKNNFVLKGGLLISSMVGIDHRSTMDIDGAIQNMPLTIESARNMLEKIIAIPLEDNTFFSIKSMNEIMDEAEYDGIRISLEAQIDKMKTSLKIDISTGDVITPRKISYQYKLIFEERIISVWAYNLETMLAEKLETVIRRGTTNTRLRDFYDLHILQNVAVHPMDEDKFKQAFYATVKKRNSFPFLESHNLILQEVRDSDVMQGLWQNYQKKFDYSQDISWNAVMRSIFSLFSIISE